MPINKKDKLEMKETIFHQAPVTKHDSETDIHTNHTNFSFEVIDRKESHRTLQYSESNYRLITLMIGAYKHNSID